MNFDIQSDVPLIGTDNNASRRSHACASNRSCAPYSSIVSKIRRWWCLTAGEAYLKSKFSRREYWPWIWPLCSFILACYTFVGPYFLPLPSIDPFAFLFYLFCVGIACRTSADRLLPDIIFACGSLVIYVDVFGRMGAGTYQASTIGVSVTPILLVCNGAIGIHSSVLIVMAIVMNGFVIANPNSSIENRVMIPYSSFIVTLLSLLAELALATALMELEERLLTTRRLLDGATDGFCTLHVESGSMSNASPQLAETLGCQRLVGRQLTDFVDENDQWKLQFGLGPESMDNPNLCSVLVTCQKQQQLPTSSSHVFDAQITPYKVCDGQISIYFKVLGELRELAGEKANASDACSMIGDSVSTVYPYAPCKTSGAFGRLDHREAPVAASGTSLNDTVFDSLVFSESTFQIQTQTKNKSVQTQWDILERPSSCFALDVGEARPRRPPRAPCSVEAQTLESPPSDFVHLAKTRTRKLPRAPGNINGQVRHRVVLNTSKRALQQFQRTPVATINAIVCDALTKINPHGKGCCPYHVTVLAVSRFLKTMLEQPCRRDFYPDVTWQCGYCFAINMDLGDDSDFSDEETNSDCTCSACHRDKYSIKASTSASDAQVFSSKVEL